MEKVNQKEYHLVLIQELSYFDKLCSTLNLKYFLMFGSLIGAVRHNGFIPWDDDLDVMMPREDYEILIDYFKNHDCSPYCIVNNDNGNAPYLISRLSDSRYHLEFKHGKPYEIGIFIDIYPMDGAGKNILFTKFYSFYVHFLMKCFSVTVEDYEHMQFSVKKICKCILHFIQKIPFFNAKKQLNKLVHKITLEKSNSCGCMNWLIDYKKEVMNKNIFEDVIRAPFENLEVNILANYNEVLTNIYGNYMRLPPEEQRIGQHFYEIYKK